jgi:hypothetical protein
MSDVFLHRLHRWAAVHLPVAIDALPHVPRFLYRGYSNGTPGTVSDQPDGGFTLRFTNMDTLTVIIGAPTWDVLERRRFEITPPYYTWYEASVIDLERGRYWLDSSMTVTPGSSSIGLDTKGHHWME